MTLGHHLLAYVEMLGRDRGRFADCRRRLNVCPLGAAALAGTSFPIDRRQTAAAPRLRCAGGELARRRFRSRFRPRVPVGGRPPRRPPVAPRRGNGDLVLRAIRVPPPCRRVLDRLVDHAAEAQSGRGRADPGEERPHHRRPCRSARRPQGPAARLRQGHAGGQGAGVRCVRYADAGAGGDDRHAGRRDVRPRAAAGRGRPRLSRRDGSRRLAGAGERVAVPPRPPRRRRPRQGGGTRGRTACRLAAGDDARRSSLRSTRAFSRCSGSSGPSPAAPRKAAPRPTTSAPPPRWRGSAFSTEPSAHGSGSSDAGSPPDMAIAARRPYTLCADEHRYPATTSSFGRTSRPARGGTMANAAAVGSGTPMRSRRRLAPALSPLLIAALCACGSSRPPARRAAHLHPAAADRAAAESGSRVTSAAGRRSSPPSPPAPPADRPSLPARQPARRPCPVRPGRSPRCRCRR